MVTVSRRPFALPGYDTRNYSPRVVTVPAPAAAPTLTVVDLGPSNYVSGHTYEFAYSYKGWTGESAVSPVTSVVQGAIPTAAYAVRPKAVLGTLAAIARIWSRDQSVSAEWRFDGSNQLSGAVAFGTADSAQEPGLKISVPAPTVSAKAIHPATDNAAHVDATAILAPTLAPDVAALGQLPVATTFYAAYSYVAADGTESALSAASAGVATPASNASYARVTVTKLPPSGVVFVNVYLSTDGITWHRQKANQQRARLIHYVHTYNAAGAAHSAGAAQSTISRLQQAYDAAILAGGATQILVSPETITTPLNFNQLDTNGLDRRNIRLVGLAGYNHNQAGTAIRYTGALTGIEMVVSSASSLSVENLAFLSTGNKIRWGLSTQDLTGGGSFYGRWEHCCFEAFYAGGVSLTISDYSAPTTHTASELQFIRCEFNGDAWAIDLAGTQTVNITFDHCSDYIPNSAQTADSGHIRDAGTEWRTVGRYFADGEAHQQILFTCRAFLPVGGVGPGTGTIEGWYLENREGTHCIVNDGQDSAGANIHLFSNRFQNQRLPITYFLYSAVESKITGMANISLGGDVFLDWMADLQNRVNNSARMDFRGERPTGQFKMAGSPDQYAAVGADAFYGVPIGLINQTGQETKVGTDSAGHFKVVPATPLTVTGSRGGNAALAALLTHLATEGVVIDGTTA